ncbi:putative SOS response-associated peptidase YedK [Hydrogenoanaerobacterium saccharovorans]|uniref:Abasic site processing protein n=1 Tax=Hydrogenoanaerobacterium saccharovorans TaxID=474960 RepID=A0A1H8AX48_9FIRM|nr:SOS response-associated peptidase [Hydrogenoanaerobacterium saccharovorans]RPF47698.1 putative SOS response-associated peptidase YedK [Hydrogenoanaerobacterium saccharovorans]SEM75310.1 Putative SOS response-associated peptidase YedK [Hydrogenoanaerobacterium saccharovorans]
MCGRYSLFTDEQNEEIRNIIEEVNKKYYGSDIKTGEIYPTNIAPVLVAKGQRLEPAPLIWGFPHFKGSGVIINARAETAEEKRMFRDSLIRRRCVIPSTGFFEWQHDESKQKYRFNLSDTSTLYMAGFYSEFKGERRYIILTTDANQSTADVHNRMPVVLQKSMLNDWVFDSDKALSILHRVPPMLTKVPV